MDNLYASSKRATLLAILVVIAALIVYPFFITRIQLLYRPLVFLSFPLLVIVAWNGYPLAYYKLTGHRFIKYLNRGDRDFDNCAVINDRVYKHPGYDKEKMSDETLTPQQRGYEPYEQRHERLLFESPVAGESAAPRFQGKISQQDEIDFRWQILWRVVLILITIIMIEPWLRALGTSWLKLFDEP